MEQENKIKEIINQLKPFLVNDGGDIEFIKYEDGVVFVRMLGACCGCPHRNETMKGGVLAALQAEMPEIKDIINVEL